ncbi:MAG: DUF5714 domain-containing protein [Eubacteriales bacterium]|nr:DUF5714 domain-containing protein [Eubacteriales bacterium]
MADYKEWDIYYDKITEKCLSFYEIKNDDKNIWEMAIELMNIPGFPMHCPQHHYLVSAVLLVACRQRQGESPANLKSDLALAEERARNVLPGFCGWYGACGAAVGIGIFLSIITDTNPCSDESWSWVNNATGQALLKMAEIGGPRCCKRNTYIALEVARDLTEEYLGIVLEKQEKTECKYTEHNQECIKDKCPFYKA